MRIFNLNIPKLVRQLLPTMLRKPLLLALLNSLTSGINSLFGRFSRNRNANLYSVNHTPQVQSLEHLLNDRYDSGLKLEVEKTLHSRSQHQHAWYIYNNPDYFTSVQRAWAVFTLSKLGFAGQLSCSLGFDKSEGLHPRKIRLAKEVFTDDLQSLLEQATIECDDAFVIIKRYDCEQAFHFIDPPYVGSNMGHYSGMFNEQNLLELLEICKNLKGKFMLTMYPNADIEHCAAANGWTVHKIDRQVSACKADSRRRQEEWIVCNY